MNNKIKLIVLVLLLISLFPIVTASIVSTENTDRVLFYDRFNGRHAWKWMSYNGNWYIEDGKYVQDVIEGIGWHWKYTKAKFIGRNYNFEADVTALTNVAYGGCSLSGYVPREGYDPYGTQISVALFPRTQQVSLYIMENGTTTEYIYYTPINLRQEYHLKAVVKNGLASVFLDGNKIISDKPTTLTSGNFWLISDDTHCLFDNVKITSNRRTSEADTN